MKHLFFAVTLTVFLFGVSLTCAELVRCRTQEVADRLTLAQAAAERADAEAARRETKEAAALWERHTPLLDALVRHAEIDGVSGVYFAVWAPNAMRVSVVGNFNNWDGRV